MKLLFYFEKIYEVIAEFRLQEPEVRKKRVKKILNSRISIQEPGRLYTFFH